MNPFGLLGLQGAPAAVDEAKRAPVRVPLLQRLREKMAESQYAEENRSVVDGPDKPLSFSETLAARKRVKPTTLEDFVSAGKTAGEFGAEFAAYSTPGLGNALSARDYADKVKRASRGEFDLLDAATVPFDVAGMLTGINPAGGLRAMAGKVAKRGKKAALPTLDDLPFLRNPSSLKPGEDWAIVTAANPGAKPLSAEENAARNAALQQRLVERYGAENVVPTAGKYGNEEPGFAVIGMSYRDAMDIGKEFGQESVLTPRGLIYTTGDKAGKFHPFKSSEFVEGVGQSEGALSRLDEAPEDFYTKVRGKNALGDEDEAIFRYNLDWDQTHDVPQALSLTSAPGVHFSPRENLTRIDPAKQGTGSAGAERARTAEGAPQRTYWYEPENQTAPVKPEDVLAGATNTYHAPLEGVYDLAADPNGLRRFALNESDLEALMRALGAKGYRSPALADAAANRRGSIAMFEPVTPAPYNIPGAAVGPAREPRPIGVAGYHGTRGVQTGLNQTSAPFDDYERTRDVGFHFGTNPEPANKMLGTPIESLGETETLKEFAKRNYFVGRSEHVRREDLHIQRPVRLPDMGLWPPKDIVDHFVERGYLTPEQGAERMQDYWARTNKGRPPQPTNAEIDADPALFDQFGASPQYTGIPDDKARTAWFNDLLRDTGHDSAIYTNAVEGGGDSLIVADPKRIKPDIGGRRKSLFDYDALDAPSGVPQVAMPGELAPRGIPKRAQEIIERIPERHADFVERGIHMKDWYNLEQLRKVFIDMHGPEQGALRWKLFTDAMGGSAQMAGPVQDTRLGLLYYPLLLPENRGLDLAIPGLDSPMPPGLGSVAQKHIAARMKAIRETGSLDAVPTDSFKLGRYSANQYGNFTPITIDRHYGRVLTGDPNIEKLNNNEYIPVERALQDYGKTRGLQGSQLQAATWVGAADATGVRASGLKPKLRIIEDVLEESARTLGISKLEALNLLVEGKLYPYGPPMPKAAFKR